MPDSAPANPAVPVTPPSDAEAREFLQVWAASMGAVLEQIAGKSFALERLPQAPPEAPAAAESDLRLIVVAAGALRGEMSFRMAQSLALALAQLFVGEPPAAEPAAAAEFKPEHREAIEELLRQIAGHAATALKPRWGEVQLRLEAGAAAPSWSAGASGWLSTAAGAALPVLIEWQLSAALNAALVAAGAAQSKPGEAPAETSPGAASAGASAGTLAGAPIAEGNLDLLMDVELEVSVRFGECSLLLREVLELAAGSVVELDREVQEPADLLLDGKLIARGEVVVVDGNYGLRVTEMGTAPE